MTLSIFNNRVVSIVLITTLLVVLAGTATGCAELEQWTTPPKAEEEKPATEAPARLVVKSEDRVIILIYEHLLSLAESHTAKSYLATFYATCDNWTAESELLRDGTTIWHAVVDMTDVEEWTERPHWQLASWFVFQDGKVIPSNRFAANALRIEADLQELSTQPEPEPEPAE